MSRIVTAVSAWLWVGIFVFLCIVLYNRREIREAELDSVHLCVIFFLCSFAGVPMTILFLLGGMSIDSSEERVETLKEMKELIDLLILFIRK